MTETAAPADAISVELATRLFRWDAWANRRTLASLKAAASPPEKSMRVMAHVAGASWLWLSRIEDEPSPLAVWPAIGLAAVEEELEEVAAAWEKWLVRATAARLASTISYTNSKGEPWTSRVDDVLLHVVLHGEHHRGQIASELRGLGAEPAYTDFIHAVRRGFVT